MKVEFQLRFNTWQSSSCTHSFNKIFHPSRFGVDLYFDGRWPMNYVRVLCEYWEKE